MLCALCLWCHILSKRQGQLNDLLSSPHRSLQGLLSAIIPQMEHGLEVQYVNTLPTTTSHNVVNMLVGRESFFIFHSLGCFYWAYFKIPAVFFHQVRSSEICRPLNVIYTLYCNNAEGVCAQVIYQLVDYQPLEVDSQRLYFIHISATLTTLHKVSSFLTSFVCTDAFSKKAAFVFRNIFWHRFIQFETQTFGSHCWCHIEHYVKTRSIWGLERLYQLVSHQNHL